MDFEQLSAHFKRLTSTLTPKQITSLALAFVGVVGVVVGSAYYVNAPSYSLLFSDMDPEAAASVVAKLKTDKVPYVLDEGGRTIRVASTRVDELRLAFSAQSMPSSGRIGFEIFDRTAFGTTEFLEHVNYRRALEGELARTIGTIAEVASARVHIAMAKDSLFSSDAQAAKASVVLKLRSNRPPSPATVSGIAGLLAASVESLRPEAVVIVDTFGRSLSKPVEESEDAGSGAPVERQQRIERDLTTRVVALLEPVVGAGHVRVNVSARLDSKSEEQTEERWDPTTVVRSKQISTDTGASTPAQGVAGARANTPPNLTTTPAEAPKLAATQTLASRTSEVTNFEVSKLTRHTIAPRGQLSRLSVAVILDDEHTVTKDAKGKTTSSPKPRAAAEMQRIQGLVAAAVGLDADRGDQLTVENIAFEEAPMDEAPTASGWWQRVVAPQGQDAMRTTIMEGARVGAVLIIAIMAFFFILKPMASNALRLPEAQLLPVAALVGGGLGPARTVADMEGEIEAEIQAGVEAKSGENRRLPVLTKRIAKAADQQPEHVARLVRNWLTEEDK